MRQPTGRATDAVVGAARELPSAVDPALIGLRVKALRESGGLSLRDLAERSGVSAPMLSQVERGETSPTLTVAARIASGLELRLSQLLRLDEQGAVTIVRAARRRRGGNPRRGHRYEVLTSAAAGPARGALAPHARRRAGRPARPTIRRSTSPAAARPRWSSRAASCWSATAPATSCARATRVTFDADLPHHFENPTAAEAAFLAVVSRRD